MLIKTKRQARKRETGLAIYRKKFTSPLTPEELGELANEMIEEKRPGKADHLQAEIVRGFYGGPADA